MSINAAIRRRKLGVRERINIDFAIDRLRLKEVIKLPNACRDELDEFYNQTASGPLASARLNGDIIAIANEDGYVNLIKTRKLENITCWMAHENAIFDIKSTLDQKKLITASGDSTIRIWDVENKTEALKFSPHHSSIKSVSIYDDNTIASGSRDGSIKIHDLRVKDQTVIIIRDAHRNTSIRKTPSKLSKTDPISCVTNVLFDPYHPRLYSAGANDATIKLWDLRRSGETNRPRRDKDGHILLNQPYQEVHHPSRGVHCGYSHLLLSSGKLYAACSDNKIYCYNRFDPKAQPTKFLGYRYDTYLRMAIFDDRYLLSGGKNGGALMWSLSNKRSSMYMPETLKQPLGQLRPDGSDRFDTNIVEADWETLSVFSMRDDGLVCKWSIDRISEAEKKRLMSDTALSSPDGDVTFQLSDIIGVNVLRPTHGVNDIQTLPMTQM